MQYPRVGFIVTNLRRPARKVVSTRPTVEPLGVSKVTAHAPAALLKPAPVPLSASDTVGQCAA
jgi:hypothetical protein